MKDTFRKRLEDPESKEHEALLKHCRKLIEMSRTEMSKNYERWDYNDAIFRSERKSDKEDRKSNEKGQPAKMIVPLTYAQTQTFIAFCVMTTTQNKRFYELEPTGKEDDPMVEVNELILERDTRKNKWTSFLVQFFLDIGRFCLGAAEVCYEESYRNMRIPVPENQETFGIVTESAPSYKWTKVPVFSGNRVHSVSPYRIFPDTRLPLTRYQEGEFCGSEDFWSISALRSQEGDFFNLDKIPKMSKKDLDDRKKTTRGVFTDFQIRENPDLGSGGGCDPSDCVKSGTVMVTKLVLDIVPKDFGDKEEGTVLGSEKFAVRFVCWIANDKTIIRFEEAYYLHCQFPYVLAQFSPDQHRNVNEGLADVCDQITTLVTWLINAHITSVKATVDGRFIIDPAGINMASLESRSPYILLKPNASLMGVDRYIKQFETRDVTAAFMTDAAALTELLEKVTSFSGNMMGQYSQGRRSATEARVVTQGASARAKTILGGIWDSAFEPLARQLIANNRQEMDFETFSRVVGEGPFGESKTKPPVMNMQGMPEPAPMEVDELFALFHADPITIATSEDFFVFDATLPSEKAFLAQSIQELVMAMLTNPEVAGVMGYGPEQLRVLMEQIYTLRGVTPARLPAPSLVQPQLGQTPTILPQSNEQVA